MLPRTVISTILKHDTKVTSYKIALMRAINDVALNFPDLRNVKQDVAIPLRILAQFWIAYYWPFVEEEPDKLILQGLRSREGSNDISFRPQLTKLRQQWEKRNGKISRPSDGFFLINQMRIPRKCKRYSLSLHQAYSEALNAISKTIEMPIKHAGGSHLWTVFAKPINYKIHPSLISIPNTKNTDKCLVVRADLWQEFQEMSFWIEALCIHEWCLFTEKVEQKFNRGVIYQLLTDRPAKRISLYRERRKICLLLMEGKEFICPWTEESITRNSKYHLDHLLPLSLYPINELWNLVPAKPKVNSHEKRDRLPSLEKLRAAQPHLKLAYENYSTSNWLSKALQQDVNLRFSEETVSRDTASFPNALANAVVNFIDIIAESRNLARFD